MQHQSSSQRSLSETHHSLNTAIQRPPLSRSQSPSVKTPSNTSFQFVVDTRAIADGAKDLRTASSSSVSHSRRSSVCFVLESKDALKMAPSRSNSRIASPVSSNQGSTILRNSKTNGFQGILSAQSRSDAIANANQDKNIERSSSSSSSSSSPLNFRKIQRGSLPKVNSSSTSVSSSLSESPSLVRVDSTGRDNKNLDTKNKNERGSHRQEDLNQLAEDTRPPPLRIVNEGIALEKHLVGDVQSHKISSTLADGDNSRAYATVSPPETKLECEAVASMPLPETRTSNRSLQQIHLTDQDSVARVTREERDDTSRHDSMDSSLSIDFLQDNFHAKDFSESQRHLENASPDADPTPAHPTPVAHPQTLNRETPSKMLTVASNQHGSPPREVTSSAELQRQSSEMQRKHRELLSSFKDALQPDDRINANGRGLHSCEVADEPCRMRDSGQKHALRQIPKTFVPLATLLKKTCLEKAFKEATKSHRDGVTYMSLHRKRYHQDTTREPLGATPHRPHRNGPLLNRPPWDSDTSVDVPHSGASQKDIDRRDSSAGAPPLSRVHHASFPDRRQSASPQDVLKKLASIDGIIERHAMHRPSSSPPSRSSTSGIAAKSPPCEQVPNRAQTPLRDHGEGIHIASSLKDTLDSSQFEYANRVLARVGQLLQSRAAAKGDFRRNVRHRTNPPEGVEIDHSSLNALLTPLANSQHVGQSRASSAQPTVASRNQGSVADPLAEVLNAVHEDPSLLPLFQRVVARRRRKTNIVDNSIVSEVDEVALGHINNKNSRSKARTTELSAISGRGGRTEASRRASISTIDATAFFSAQSGEWGDSSAI